jgi:hypothetical protein
MVFQITSGAQSGKFDNVHRHCEERLRRSNPDTVMPGLDPRIHQPSKESFEEDGLPGQARQ